MHSTVGIEITENEIRSGMSPDGDVGGAVAMKRLRYTPVRAPIPVRDGDTLKYLSIHGRLNPKSHSQSAAQELVQAFRGLSMEARKLAEPNAPLVAVVTVPSSYSRTQRQLMLNIAYDAGFQGATLVDMPIAAALGSNDPIQGTTSVLSLYFSLDSFAAAVVEVGPKICRGLSLEVSDKCSIGGFMMAACSALLASTSDTLRQTWLADPTKAPNLHDTLIHIIGRNDPLAELSVQLDGVSIRIAPDLLRTHIQPLIEELRTRISDALGDKAVDCIYAGNAASRSMPFLSDLIASVVPGKPRVTGDNAVLIGALRFGNLFPPELKDPSTKSHAPMVETSIPQPEAFEAISRLEMERDALAERLSQLNGRLASEYDRAAQMHRAQGLLRQAWDLSRKARALNPQDPDLLKRHSQIGLEVAVELARRPLSPEFKDFIQLMKDSGVNRAFINRAIDYRDIFLAEYYVNTKRDAGSARRLLRVILKRSPGFSRARDLLEKLDGRRS